jgi:hypothetical protein
MYDIMDLRYSQPRTDVDEFYQVPTLVQFDVMWAREDSVVFTGANYPPPPPPRYKYSLDDSDVVSEEKIRKSRDFVTTQIPGEVTAVPLTSSPLAPGAEEEPELSTLSSSTSARKTTTFRRKKTKTPSTP